MMTLSLLLTVGCSDGSSGDPGGPDPGNNGGVGDTDGLGTSNGAGEDAGSDPGDATEGGTDSSSLGMDTGGGGLEDAPPGQDTEAPGVDAGEPSEATADVYERLRPSCEGCHQAGTSFPAFAALESFQSLVVGNAAFVVAGDADASELVRLLTAQGTRQFVQMPIGERSFVDLEESGETLITVAEIRAWIGELGEEAVTVEAPEPVLVRRMTAEQIQAALYAQLGLEDGDWFQVNPDTGEIGSVSRQRYPVHGPDAPPFIHANAGNHAQLRFLALGGPEQLAGTPRNQELSPLLGHTLTQVAQAWCRLSYDKDGNDALFGAATRADTSASAEPAIRENIRYLFLRMLGVVAGDDEVDDLYQSVFLTYEAREDTRTAWIAVCASMVRDPLWLTY